MYIQSHLLPPPTSCAGHRLEEGGGGTECTVVLRHIFTYTYMYGIHAHSVPSNLLCWSQRSSSSSVKRECDPLLPSPPSASPSPASKMNFTRSHGSTGVLGSVGTVDMFMYNSYTQTWKHGFYTQCIQPHVHVNLHRVV